MSTILIRGGRVIDPSQNIDRVTNVLLRGTRIVGIDDNTTIADRLIDATGLIVCPGLIDSHVALREPGDEKDETIASGTAAALAGGFTAIAAMPDTAPVVDNRAAAEFVSLQSERAGHCHVFPLGAVTKNHDGEELAEIGQLVEGGAVAFTDGKKAIANAEVMRRALQYTRMLKCPVLSHPQVPELAAGGVMHEGLYSTLIGLQGIPAAAEEVAVARDVALAKTTGGQLHLMCVSTAESVELIRRGKRHGVRVTADVAPHHLALTDAELQAFNSNHKVDPPLRTQEHIDAVIEALKDDTIEAICSDHQPFASEKKQRELDLVPFGIVGLETLLPICIKTLIEPGHLTWPQLIAKLTIGPARVLGLQKGTLKPDADADITLIDPELEWVIDPAAFESRSRNTPFGGWTVHGRAHTVIVAGDIRYEAKCS